MAKGLYRKQPPAEDVEVDLDDIQIFTVQRTTNGPACRCELGEPGNTKRVQILFSALTATMRTQLKAIIKRTAELGLTAAQFEFVELVAEPEPEPEPEPEVVE